MSTPDKNLVTIQPQNATELSVALEPVRQSKASPAASLVAVSRIFHRLVLTLTDEKGYVFRNFYTRFRFLLSRLPLSAADQASLEAFRRYLREVDFDRIPNRAPAEAADLVQRLIDLAAGGKPGRLSNFFTKWVSQRDYGALENFKVLCDSWSDIENINGKAAFYLTAFNLDEMTRQLRIRVRDSEHDNITDIRKWLAPGAVLQLQHLRRIGETGDSYETTFDSLLTLEPDYLLDATIVGECFQQGRSNPNIFWLDQLVGDLPGLPALRGSIINYYLDEMVRDKAISPDAVYIAAQRDNAMRAARFGSRQMAELKKTIHTQHLANIKDLVAEHGQNELWIEPTYFSTRYGLQGRIDLLSINPRTASRDIIELKSGKPSPTSLIAWTNHTMQVVCYDMMLESTYGQDRKGTNFVYYSQCGDKPYRQIVSEHRERKEALGLRNEIVAGLFRLASKDFSTLADIRQNGIHGLPSYKNAALESFQRNYQPDKITSEYYQQMVAFLLRELINEKIGNWLRAEEEARQEGFAGLWLDSLETKRQDFRIIYDMTVTGIQRAESIVSLVFPPEIEHAFRKGDPVVLYPRSDKGYDALSQHILKGSITGLHHGRLSIILNNKQTNYEFIEGHSHWAIEPDIYERNTWHTISGLFNLLKADMRKRKLLFGHEAPVTRRVADYHNPQLTAIQNRAIQQALDARDYYLLQGPPGTGKTSTFLLNYVRESLRRIDHCIVVLAFTNRAVEKICETLTRPRSGSPVPYLRMGSRHVDDDALFSRQIDSDDPDTWKAVIHGHRVFVSTVSTFQNNWALLKEFVKFSEIIIDEASQLTEAAIAGILVLFDKFILIGDQKQLPAVVTQDKEQCRVEGAYMQQLGLTDLRVSLFERMVRNARSKGWRHAHEQLQDHYRMHTEIANLITTHYEGTLVAGTDGQKDGDPPYVLPSDHRLAAISAHRVVFIQAPVDHGIKKNEAEAKIAAELANTLIGEGLFRPDEIGIIAPFRAQVAAIKRHLDPKLALEESFVVDTVERYQGDERKLIIFSTTICRSGELNTIQSTWNDDVSTADRKLLVAISRAKQQFILLGNADALRSSPAYRQILDGIPALSLSH